MQNLKIAVEILDEMLERAKNKGDKSQLMIELAIIKKLIENSKQDLSPLC